MAIRTEAVTLDVRPCCDARGPVVCGRQGDDGTVLVATVTRDGEPLALDGLSATLKGNVPGYTETAGTVDGSAATFALDSSVFAHRGVHRLYVELSQGADAVASTQSVELRVAPGADADAGEAEEFESFIDQMKQQYEAGIDQAEAAFDAALEAKQQEAQGLIDELDDALDTLGLPVYRVDGADAVPQKECYFSYEDADTGCDVFGYSDGSEVHQITPAWQTQRGGVVRASGCAAGVPVAGARVLGQTRQNLWVNQGTVTRNGVTITNNTDGSIALSGTSTGTVTGGADSYALRPGETYTASVNAASTTSTNTAEGSFYVQARAADGSMITGGTHYFGFSTTLSVTFTVPDDAAYYSFGFYCIALGNTFSGTYRVMLNEGSEAEPWCPPGLSSVSELETVTAGKNLVDASSMAINKAVENETGEIYTTSSTGNWYATETKIPCPPPGSSIVCSADSARSSSIAFYFGDGTFISGKSISKTQAVTVPDGASLMAIDVYKDYFANFQLELGSTATAYEPPAVTTTPIDLAGHELRSLPDGTRDVLTVDGSGAVSVEQAVMSYTATGEEGVNYKADSHECVFVVSGVGDNVNPGSTDTALCDKLPKTTTTQNTTGFSFLENAIHFMVKDVITDAVSAKQWLAQNNPTFILPMATPQTVPLDPIAPPSIPAADATLWAASDVPCDIEATTWTASGAEQGRQQAAMVKVAQQVRQQAETVAALTTQALEA